MDLPSFSLTDVARCLPVDRETAKDWPKFTIQIDLPNECLGRFRIRGPHDLMVLLTDIFMQNAPESQKPAGLYRDVWDMSDDEFPEYKRAAILVYNACTGEDFNFYQLRLGRKQYVIIDGMPLKIVGKTRWSIQPPSDPR